jgi:hypothetical protein
MWPFKRRKTTTVQEVAKQIRASSNRQVFRDLEEFSTSRWGDRFRDATIAIMENRRRHSRIGKITLKCPQAISGS